MQCVYIVRSSYFQYVNSVIYQYPHIPSPISTHIPIRPYHKSWVFFTRKTLGLNFKNNQRSTTMRRVPIHWDSGDLSKLGTPHSPKFAHENLLLNHRLRSIHFDPQMESNWLAGIPLVISSRVPARSFKVSQVIVVLHIVPQLVRGHLREYGLLIFFLSPHRVHGGYKPTTNITGGSLDLQGSLVLLKLSNKEIRRYRWKWQDVHKWWVIQS